MRLDQRSVRRCVLAITTASTLVASAIGVGAQPASADSLQPPAATRIAIIAGSTQLAVRNLQHAPDLVKRLAARLIIDEAKLFLRTHGVTTGHAAAAQTAAPAAIAPPGTVIGGLFLDGYCQDLGFDHSEVNGAIVAPGAAFQWFCVATSGAQTPIIMQSACIAQYPGQLTIAFPQDVNDAYSWICIAPATGHFTDPGSGTTVDTLTAGNSGATLIVSGSGTYTTFDQNGSGGSVVVNSDGSGYIADGQSTSTLPI